MFTNNQKRISEIRLQKVNEAALAHGTCAIDIQLSVARSELRQEQVLNMELKQQLEELRRRVEAAETALSMARHNLLQQTLKMEETAAKAHAVESLRLDDLKAIEHLLA